MFFFYFCAGTCWSFKNPAKVYGSPMLDAAVRDSKHVQSTRYQDLLRYLKQPDACNLADSVRR